jgi:hypothetical protein
MNNVAEEMRHLNELAKRDPCKRFTKLWDNLTDIRWLAQAWELHAWKHWKGPTGCVNDAEKKQ